MKLKNRIVASVIPAHDAELIDLWLMSLPISLEKFDIARLKKACRKGARSVCWTLYEGFTVIMHDGTLVRN